jgi:hypothetical protein
MGDGRPFFGKLTVDDVHPGEQVTHLVSPVRR